MTEREALKLALEALSKVGYVPDAVNPHPISIAIAAIKEVLAQPEQEPVRVMGFNCVCGRRMEVSAEQGVVPAPQPEPVIDKSAAVRIATVLGWEPKRKPLTDEEIILIVADCASSHQHTDIHFARAIEAAHGIKE